MAVFDLDMQNLTLHVRGEDHARVLQCKVLEPDEKQEHQPLSLEELKEIFDNGACVEEEEDEGEGGDAGNEDANIEAENLEPEEAPAFHDEVEPDMPYNPPPEDEDIEALDAEGYDLVEEVLWEAPMSTGRSPIPQEADAIVSSTASSSKGLNATPADIRQSVPAGAKLQHKRAKLEGRCSGWQAWPAGSSSDGPQSKWFSYGVGGQFASSDEARDQAIKWTWGQSH